MIRPQGHRQSDQVLADAASSNWNTGTAKATNSTQPLPTNFPPGKPSRHGGMNGTRNNRRPVHHPAAGQDSRRRAGDPLCPGYLKGTKGKALASFAKRHGSGQRPRPTPSSSLMKFRLALNRTRSSARYSANSLPRFWPCMSLPILRTSLVASS